MAMQSVLCEVVNKWWNTDYFSFRLHRLTHPAIIRCTSARAGHVNNDHKNCAACVSFIEQGTGTKAWQMTKKHKTKKKTSPWKLKRGARKVGHKVYAASCGSQSPGQSNRSPAVLIHSQDNLHQRIRKMSSESLLQPTVLQ